jgi:nucleoside-diphosphate-sugar epimerase
MTSPIAITGVTGVMGRQVADILASKSLPLRLLVRGGASRSPAIDNADVVDFEGYHDKQSCANALKGCDICFMVSGREDPDVSIKIWRFKACTDAYDTITAT